MKKLLTVLALAFACSTAAFAQFEKGKKYLGADINGLDSVNANSVIGKVYITVHGVINDIFIDLIALPASVDLNSISI